MCRKTSCLLAEIARMLFAIALFSHCSRAGEVSSLNFMPFHGASGPNPSHRSGGHYPVLGSYISPFFMAMMGNLHNSFSQNSTTWQK